MDGHCLSHIPGHLPLVGGQEELHEHVGDVGVGERLVVGRRLGHGRQAL